jgi:LysR family transcriptional regulator, regulator of abg operon
MKYHQLKAFLTVAEQGSIRAAARSLHLSQAALTKALKELESDLGVSLVLRTTRGVQLTAYGLRLRTRAQMIVSEMRRAEEDIEHLRSAGTGKVAAAITPTTAMSFLPAAYRAFRKRMPHAQVSFIEGFTGVALPRLREGSLDFVVAVVVEEQLAPEFDYFELYRSQSVIVARQDHPLARSTTLAELVDAEWLLNPSPESSTRRLLDFFSEQGLPVPQRVVECPSFVIAHALLRGSDAIASLPEPLLDHPWVGHGLTVLPIIDPLPPIAIGVVTRRDSPLTPAASMLLDCLQEATRTRV